MAVTLYGIAGLQDISYDEVLNIARSLANGVRRHTRPIAKPFAM